MSLFWRLMAAFVITAAATFAAQRLIGRTESVLPTVPMLEMANSPLVDGQAESALEELAAKGPTYAVAKLRVIERSGLHAWLITDKQSVGATTLPPYIADSARNLLVTGHSGSLPLGYRMHIIRDDGKSGILVLLIPGLFAPQHLLWRAILLIGIPIGSGLFLARRLSSPIQKVALAASRLANGDLNSRVGAVGGPNEVRELAHSFDAMAQRIQDTVEAQERLLVDLSHEIRSPLARIRLAAKMLDEGKGDAATNLARIERDIVRMDEWIGSMAIIMRPDSAIDTGETLDLEELSREVLNDSRFEAGEKGIEIDSQLSPAIIKGNRLLLRSAIENVVRNAILHSPPSTTIEFELGGEPPCIKVRDRGPGVSADELDKIFEPFYRCSEARERDSGGTGLGLAIVNKAAKAHRGQARAERRESGGLVVSIRLGPPPAEPSP